jgi:UDP-N-acetylglucosamine acyltransferase
MSGAGIHPTAQVDAGARIGVGTTIGAYSIIGADVVIGDECIIHPHAVIAGPTTIGARNRVFPFACIGMEPQDLKFGGERTTLEIGDGNTFREGVTVHRGHDCVVADRVIFANAATLAGHVIIEPGATIGAFSGVHQFCRIGAHAYIGGYSVITQDAMPFVLTVGNRAQSHGINVIGLQRKQFTDDAIRSLRRAYRTLFRSHQSLEAAIEKVRDEFSGQDEVEQLLAFIQSSTRGVIR